MKTYRELLEALCKMSSYDLDSKIVLFDNATGEFRKSELDVCVDWEGVLKTSPYIMISD